MTLRPTAPRAPAAARAAPVLWPYAVVAGAVTLLAVTSVLPRWPGLLHLVAIPPIDQFADLRLLLSYAPSWPAFVGLLVVVTAFRAVVLALALGGLTADRLRFAALVYLVPLPLLLLAAELDYVAYALLYSRLFWPSLVLVAMVAIAHAPVAWTGSFQIGASIRQAWRDGLRVEVVLPYGLALIALGWLADTVPGFVPALVPVSAVATALAVRALARPPGGRPMRRLVAAALAGVVAAGVFVVWRERVTAEPGSARDGSLLIMSGINSSSGWGSIFRTDVGALGYDCDQVYYFSYAGPGDGQPRGVARCPIRTGAPYGPADTQRPLAEQVAAFSAQVRELPRPLVVAGHSQAGWVAWEAVASGAAPEVDVLVLVGPFPESPSGYLPAGKDGPGRAASDLLHMLVPLSDLVDFNFAVDAPASLELLADTRTVPRILAQPLPPDVAALSLTSATDLPLMPAGWRLPVDRNACPLRVAHPYLSLRPLFTEEVNRFLDGRPARHCPVWRDWGAGMARPFGTPSGE